MPRMGKHRPYVALLALLLVASIALPAAASSDLARTSGASIRLARAAPLLRRHARLPPPHQLLGQPRPQSITRRGRRPLGQGVHLRYAGRRRHPRPVLSGPSKALAAKARSPELTPRTRSRTKPPFDLGGLDATRQPRGFDTTTAGERPAHAYRGDRSERWFDGRQEPVSSRCTTARAALLFGPERLHFKVGRGGRDEKTLRLFTSDGKALPTSALSSRRTLADIRGAPAAR